MKRDSRQWATQVQNTGGMLEWIECSTETQHEKVTSHTLGIECHYLYINGISHVRCPEAHLLVSSFLHILPALESETKHSMSGGCDCRSTIL